MHSRKEQNISSHIQHVIGVMSGKGGVGKSFVTGYLASKLNKEGYRVGILDAELTGSSIPLMFGLRGSAKVGQYSFLPLQSRSGIKIISLNVLFDNEDQSIVWKGSATGEVIKQLWKEVEWETLDFLFVDMPPATSEVGITIMQELPFTGVITVSTPQRITTKIVSNAVFTAQKMGVSILGIVENMSYYQSPETGEKLFVFGEYKGESVADAAKAPVLAQLPIDPTAAQMCDLGKIDEVVIDGDSQFVESFLKSLSEIIEKDPTHFVSSEDSHPDNAISGEQEATKEYFEEYSSTPQHEYVRESFSDTVKHLIQSKENMGVLDHPDAQGFFRGRCGDRMQIDLRTIDGRIIEAKFLADGCGATLACGSMITKMACPNTFDQANRITSDDLLTALGGLPHDHLHCAELAVMTLREAVVDAIEGYGKPRSKYASQMR